MLSQLKYSRDFETEADEFAVRVLRTNELTPKPLLSFFECLRRRPEQRLPEQRLKDVGEGGTPGCFLEVCARKGVILARVTKMAKE